MKIVAFAQLHEELRKGNLENWYRSLEGCDTSTSSTKGRVTVATRSTRATRARSSSRAP